MLGFKNFLMEEDGVGVVEMVLIVVVLDDGTIASITEKWLGDDMTKRIIPEDTQE